MSDFHFHFHFPAQPGSLNSDLGQPQNSAYSPAQLGKSVKAALPWSTAPNLMGLLDTHSSVQFSSVAQSCLTLCDPTNRSTLASLSITKSQSLPKLMPIELVMPSSHLILCHPLLLLPPIPPSIRVFSNESALHMRWPKHWSFSFSISPSSEHPGLISFRMDWLDLLAVQGTLKSLLQHTVQKHQFSVLSFLYSPTLTSIHDYWKNHNFY